MTNITFIDLSKYYVAPDDVLITWAKEILHSYTGISDKHYDRYYRHIKYFEYYDDLDYKFMLGLPYFTMSIYDDKWRTDYQARALHDKSVLFYGMAHLADQCQHLALKIAKQIFYHNKWTIVNGPEHSYLINEHVNLDQLDEQQINVGLYDVNRPMIFDISMPFVDFNKYMKYTKCELDEYQYRKNLIDNKLLLPLPT